MEALQLIEEQFSRPPVNDYGIGIKIKISELQYFFKVQALCSFFLDSCFSNACKNHFVVPVKMDTIPWKSNKSDALILKSCYI